MAGMLPGVELARRRRIHHHQVPQFPKNSSSSSSSSSSFSAKPSSRDPSLALLTSPRSSTMDEAAFKARRRLEEKLRRPTAAPTVTAAGDGVYRRRINNGHDDQIQCRKTTHNETQGTNYMKFVRLQRWSSGFQRQKSQKEVCAICLDEFQSEQPVVNLPCFHRYHSKCVLPWLSSQSQCPYCRTHFQESC
ncbi:hypothetical protein Sjap_008045 [Stephania japonica]|uniref:RING-type domain-containing protein n=1 Tax=Stephania japonica TaxID=461633 RepID=A0AAP0JNR7_9MAGN